MPLAILTFLTGISISAVAIYYSVLGLASIFAAAVIPIYVMGTILELSKLVTAWWLKANWHRAPLLLKSYMFIAVVVLMLITSMGIFGFLSKAHSDQSLVSGDVQSKIAVYDEKIKTARENIDANRKALKQLDEAVDQSMARSTTETGADKAVAIRRAQAKERARLQSEIQAEQKTINRLSEERAPIAAEVRKVEAEVGPIKYIAALIYGDSPDTNLLEKAVTWVIIIIVLVFDPLAVLLLLASQLSFQWTRANKEENNKVVQETTEIPKNENPVEPLSKEIKQTPVLEDVVIKPEEKPIRIDPHPVGWMYSSKPETKETLSKEEVIVVSETTTVARSKDDTETDENIMDAESLDIRAAMAQWKADNPADSLKHQRMMLQRGLITKLPWEKDISLKPVVDEEHEAAVEAAKWAQEQLDKSDSSKKKDNDVDGTSGQSTDQTDKRGLKSYVQNAEQNSSTIWQRVKNAKND